MSHDPCPTDWTAIITSLASLAAAVAALLAVVQSARHREASYRPELLMLRTEFEYSSSATQENDIRFDDWRHRQDGRMAGHGDDWFRVSIANVGLGAAKWVELKWSFPVEKAIKKINAQARQIIGAELLDYNNGAFKVTYGSTKDMVCVWENQRAHRLDSIVPAGGVAVPQSIIVPPAYAMIVTALVWLAARTNHGATEPDIPLLTAKLRYCDIGGKKHDEELVLRAQVVMTSLQGSHYLGYLENAKPA